MKTCQKHWIELRDKFESSNKIIASQMASQMILLDSTVLANKYRDPHVMQDAIGPNGCLLCFFQQELNQDPMVAIEKKLEEMPKEKLDEFMKIDKDLVERNKSGRGQP